MVNRYLVTLNSYKTVSYFSFRDEFWEVHFLVTQTQHSINSVVEFVHNLKSCYKYVDDWVKGFRVKQTVCYQSFMRRILHSKHLELKSVTFCSVSFNPPPLSVNNEWMHIHVWQLNKDIARQGTSTQRSSVLPWDCTSSHPLPMINY